MTCLGEIKVPRHFNSGLILDNSATSYQSSAIHLSGVSSPLSWPQFSIDNERLCGWCGGWRVDANCGVERTSISCSDSLPKSMSLTSQQTLCEFAFTPHWTSRRNFATLGFVRWSLLMSAVMIETQKREGTHLPKLLTGVTQSGWIISLPTKRWKKMKCVRPVIYVALWLMRRGNFKRFVLKNHPASQRMTKKLTLWWNKREQHEQIRQQNCLLHCDLPSVSSNNFWTLLSAIKLINFQEL